MSSFLSSVEKTVSRYNMLSTGDTVIIALSGGADSVSLLYALYSLKEKYSLNLKAAHMNHNLRGDEALRDENFCRKICEEKGVELFVKSVDINAVAEKEKISTELAGRNERYKFFGELSERYGAKIATAHNADDNVETVVFNLIRGAGLNGLGGIKPVRGNIIRPLIRIERADIEEYLNENSIPFVTDSTNLTDDYTRNKIRHLIVPVMREINPNAAGNIADESELLSGVNSFVELKANEFIDEIKVENGYSAERLKTAPEALRSAVILELIKRNGGAAEKKHITLIESILDFGAVDLCGNLRAVSKQGVLRFINTEIDNILFSEKELKLPMEFDYNGKNYSVKEIKSDGECIKLSVLDKKPVFRTRRAGDKFTLAKRKVTKSLKKLFNELKIPEEKRDSVLILADGSEVLWIEGVGVSENARAYNEVGFIIDIKNKKE